MPSSGAIRAGKAYVELNADGGPLTRGLKSAAGQLKSFGSTVAGIGKTVAATAAGYLSADFLKSMGKEVLEAGSRLAIMSARTGASVKSLQTLGYAADRTGGSMEDVGGAMTHIRDQIAAAAAGSDDALKSFALLGLDFNKLASMSPDEQFRKIAEAVNKIPHPAQKAYFATKLLGNADLVPLLGQMGALEDRAKQLGIVMSDEDAAAALDFSNSMKDLWDIVKSVAVTIASALAPAAKWIVDVAIKAATAIRDWVKANLDLENAFGAVQSAIEVAGAAIYGAWVANIAKLRRAWVEFRTFATDVTISLGEAISKALIDAFGYIRENFRQLSTDIIKGILTLTMMIDKKSVDLSPAEKIGIDMAANLINAALNPADLKKAVSGAADDLRKANKDSRKQDLAGIDAEDKAANDALVEAINKAKNRKKGKGPDAAAVDAAKNIPGAKDLMGLSSSVMGTFSARAVGGFSQGNTVFNAIKNGVMQTAQNTALMAKRAQGLGFS